MSAIKHITAHKIESMIRFFAHSWKENNGNKICSKNISSKTATEGDWDKWKDQEESLRNEETIAESGRIFVRNLAYTVSKLGEFSSYVIHP